MCDVSGAGWFQSLFFRLYLQRLVQAPPVIELDAFLSDVHSQATHLPLNKQGLTLLQN